MADRQGGEDTIVEVEHEGAADQWSTIGLRMAEAKWGRAE